MSDAVARPIGFGAALAEQLRWFWRRLRVWIVIVSVLTAGTAAWIISMVPAMERPMSFLIVGNVFHPLFVLIALSWALSAWRDDPPRDRQYFWLHPVPRTRHTIARSLAGALWLLAVVGFVIVVVLVATRVTYGPGAIMGSPRFWLYVVGAIALAYIAASIAAVLSDKPGLWMVGVVAVVVLTGVIATIREIEWLKTAVSAFQGGKYSFGTALGGPGVESARLLAPELAAAGAAENEQVARMAEADPTTALLIWLPIALALYLAAARLSRPR